MKKINKSFILTLAISVCGVFFIFNSAQAMPIGTLLYRTSSGEQMYGYNTNDLFKMDGLNPKINCGHVGIYAGIDENNEHLVLETISNGVRLVPAKYFVNLSKKEKFIGAKIPKKFNENDIEQITKIINFLGNQGLNYDFDLKHQKGPLSGQWTCVGLVEKIYESLDFGKKFVNLNQLEYAPQKYEIDITLDGHDNTSAYNKDDDYFSEKLEFSKVGRGPGELVGYWFGKVISEDRYFFFPYTQFLQNSLKNVKVDIPLESSFIEGKIRGTPPKGKIIAKALINNTESSIRITADRTKKLVIKIKDFFTGKEQKLVKKEKDLGDVLPAEEKEEKIFPEIILEDLISDHILASEKISSQEEIIELSEKEIILEEKPVLAEKDNQEIKLGIDYVIDGDTFVLITGEKVRYIGINTPELGEDGQEDDECLAWVARLRNIELLTGGELKLTKDEGVDKDKYGRLLRYVYINDIFINEQLAREGLAEVFFCEENWKNCPIIKNLEEQKIISQASQLAKQNKLGLFSGICEDKKEKKIAKKEDIKQNSDNKEEKEEKKEKPKGNVSKLPLFHTGGSSGDENNNKKEEKSNEKKEEDDDKTIPEEKPIINLVISEFVTRGLNDKATNEFLELYNPNSSNINILGWRIQYKSATGESWRNKTGKKGLPEITIPANGYILLAGKSYNYSTTPDYKHSANWGLADDGGHVRLLDDLSRKIDKVGYGKAIDPEGEASQADLSDGISLERKAFATSTSETMVQGGNHWPLGNAYDSNNNKNDFVVKQNPEPQNSSSPKEPGKIIPTFFPETINDLSVISSSTATNSVILIWSTPKFANLGKNSYYNLRYMIKEKSCNLDKNWIEAISMPTSLLPMPATTAGEEQTAKIVNLLPNTEYCFAIKTYNSQNWSQISNQTSEKTSEEVIEEVPVELRHIRIGGSSYSGELSHKLRWNHTIEEGENRVLIVSIFMHTKRVVGTMTFNGINMTKASETTHRSRGINSIIFYLKNPPVGTNEIFMYLDNGFGTTLLASAINLYNCDLKNLIIDSSEKVSSDGNFSTDIESPFSNALAIEAITLDDRSKDAVLSPLSGQTRFYKDIFNHVYYGFSVAMSYKELEQGINTLMWEKEGPNNVTQNIIVLKPISK